MLKAFGDLLVSASADGAVRVWDLKTDSCVRTFEEQGNAIWACGMNENQTLLATGSVHGDMKIWSIADG